MIYLSFFLFVVGAALFLDIPNPFSFLKKAKPDWRTLGMYRKKFIYSDTKDKYDIIVTFKVDQFDNRKYSILGRDASGEKSHLKDWFMTTNEFVTVIEPWREKTLSFVELTKAMPEDIIVVKVDRD